MKDSTIRAIDAILEYDEAMSSDDAPSINDLIDGLQECLESGFEKLLISVGMMRFALNELVERGKK